MENLSEKSLLNKKVVYLIIILFLTDLYFLYKLISLTYIFSILPLFIFTILVNTFCILRLKKIARNKPKKSRSVNSIISLLDEMTFLEPTQFETVVEKPVEIIPIEPVVVEPIIIDTVIEIPFQILKPKSVIATIPVFDKPIVATNYCDDFAAYCIDSGLAVDKNSIRELFASMATSKLIIINHEKVQISERFIELFTEFIGANLFVDEDKPDLVSFDEFYGDDYRLKTSVIDASKNMNRFYFWAIKQLNNQNVDPLFDKIMDFSMSPLLPSEIESQHFDTIQTLPNNLWFLILPNDHEEMIASEKLATSSVTLELSAKIVTPKEEVTQNSFKLSYLEMTSLLFDGYELYYLEESDWKKMDQIEGYLNEMYNYTIDNRLFRQLERYTSTFLMFGGDKNEAIDSVLFTKLLRIISQLQPITTEKSEDSLLSLFERLFGLENLRLSKNLLKVFKEDNPNNIIN